MLSLSMLILATYPVAALEDTTPNQIKNWHPQFQHVGDFTEAFKKMSTTIEIIRLKDPKDIYPAYKKAFLRKDGKNTILVEYGDYYNEK